MSDSRVGQIENRDSVRPSDATQNLQQEALTLFQCKDGSLVRNPQMCTKTLGMLPELELSGTQLAGKTFRRSDEGWTSDGGKVVASA